MKMRDPRKQLPSIKTLPSPSLTITTNNYKGDSNLNTGRKASYPDSLPSTKNENSPASIRTIEYKFNQGRGKRNASSSSERTNLEKLQKRTPLKLRNNKENPSNVSSIDMSQHLKRSWRPPRLSPIDARDVTNTQITTEFQTISSTISNPSRSQSLIRGSVISKTLDSRDRHSISNFNPIEINNKHSARSFQRSSIPSFSNPRGSTQKRTSGLDLTIKRPQDTSLTIPEHPDDSSPETKNKLVKVFALKLTSAIRKKTEKNGLRTSSSLEPGALNRKNSSGMELEKEDNQFSTSSLERKPIKLPDLGIEGEPFKRNPERKITGSFIALNAFLSLKAKAEEKIKKGIIPKEEDAHQRYKRLMVNI